MSGEVALGKIAGPDEATLNVIFVHGLGGDARGTWTYDETPAKASGKLGQLLPKFLRGAPSLTDSKGLFWPEWLAEDMRGLAVYSLDYPSDPKRWRAGWSVTKSAGAILDALVVDRRLRRNSAPIVFVCHSLGGLVVKKLIVTANIDKGQEREKGAFLDRIAGVAFLATPHQGAFLATFLSEFGWLAASDSLRDLEANSDNLLDMGNSYRSMIEDDKRRIAHRVYYEDEKVMRGLRIVNAGSADPGLTGVRPVAVLRDHISICKMQKKDQVYDGVLALLEDALKPRPDTARKVLEDAKENTGTILQQQNLDSTKLDALSVQVGQIKELLTHAYQSGAAQRAIDQGIPEAALRAIVERLGGEGLSRDDLVPWLDQWTAAAVRELRGGANEGKAFDRAFEKARELFNAGRIAEASQPFMEELARRRKAEELRREEERRAQLRLVEEAVNFDKLAFEGEAAAAKLREMADIEGKLTPDEIGAFLFEKAGEFYEIGDRTGDNAALLVAIAAYREALKERTQEHVPLQWAATQHNLGVALNALGERESGTLKLTEAIVAHREALKEYTRERAPLKWAGTKMNLGNVLLSLGERESGPEKIEEAIASFRDALGEITQELSPQQWAMTHDNLGNALQRLGERKSDTKSLEEAVAAYRQALKERTREREPLGWAITQSNLGAALQALAEREGGTARLEESVAAYREALKVYTRERAPLKWAGMQNNLGTAFSMLGGSESGPTYLIEAVTAFREALKEYTRKRVPLQWAMTQTNLGNALQALGQSERGTAQLEDAVTAYGEALKVYTEERTPLQWALSFGNQGIAMLKLADRKNDTMMAQEALRHIKTTLTLMQNANYTVYIEFYGAHLAVARSVIERLTA
jgi:tetratricopeptide (TPR) repeat protein